MLAFEVEQDYRELTWYTPSIKKWFLKFIKKNLKPNFKNSIWNLTVET